MSRRHAQTVASRAVLIGFVGAVAFLVVLPLVRLQWLALEGGGRGYADVYQSRGMGEVIWRTVALGLGSLVIAMMLGTLLGWVASRLPRHYRLMRSLPVFPIVVPSVASVVGWTFIFSPRAGYGNQLLRELPWWSDLTSGPFDVFTVPWIILITGFMLTPFVYLFVIAGIENINDEHIEAAQVAGSSATGTFFKVVLPLLRPALVYGAGIVVLLGLGQFTAPALLGTNRGIEVLTTKMYSSIAEYPVDYAAAAAIAAPLAAFGLVVVMLQKLGLSNQSRFVTHSGKSFKSAGKSSRSAAAVILFYFFVSTVLPILALTVVALSKYWSGSVAWGNLTLDNLRTVLSRPDITNAFLTSIIASLVSVAIVLPMGFVAASILLRGRRFRASRALLDFLVSLPLGMPAVLFGAGFLLAYSYPPFILYGSRWLIILVYITLMIPFGTRMLLSGMVSLGDDYIEASRVSGASTLRTNLRIVLPLLRTNLAAAAALIFVMLSHEFTASMFVRVPPTQVAGTVLMDYWRTGSYPTVAAIALVMTIVTGLGVVLAVAAGGRNVFSRL